MKKALLLAASVLLQAVCSYAQWTQLSFLTSDPIQCVAAKGGAIFAGTQHGVFTSLDGGVNWTNSSAGLTDSNITALIISGSNIISGSGGGKTAYKNLLGSTWTEHPATSDVDPITSFFKNGAAIWAKHCCGTCSTYESTNDGVSWHVIAISGCFKNFIWNSGKLYHGDWTGPVVSTDGGSTWTPANTGYGATSDFTLMGADETNAIVLSRGYWGDASQSTLYYATSSTSPTWNLTSSFSPGHTAAIRAFVGFSNFIYAGVNDTATGTSHADNGLHYSTDAGKNWTADMGIVSNGVNALTIDSLTMYAGGQNGSVWKRALVIPNNAIKGLSGNLPAAIIFPNPTTGRFRVSLEQPMFKESGIEIYSLTGEILYQCRTQQAEMDIDLSGKSKGIYFIRIDDGNTVQYGKLAIQ